MKAAGLITLLFLASCMQGSGSFGGGGGYVSGTSTDDDNSITKERMSPGSYVKWVEDEKNGLKEHKVIDDMVYTAQYKPYDYIICEEEKKDVIPDTIVKSELKELNGLQYIDLKIALKSGQGELLKYNLPSTEDYNGRVNYFSFGMQKDIQLIQNGDTLPCVLFHFERIYDIAPYATFLMGFPLGKHPEADKTLQFSDHVFNKGIIKFFFKGKEVKNTPSLETI